MSSLPSYVAAAQPVPQSKRVAWFSSTAQTYAGIMLWFVFWQGLAAAGGTPGGTLAAGLPAALIGLILAALFCHFLFYLVPALLGLQTGLPLYVVGTSTYGVHGGFIMPGFLMGLLQFGWLGVNAFAASELLCKCFGIGLQANKVDVAVPGAPHAIIAIIWAAGAAFMGLKGIQYVARVATYLPLIPVVVLIVLFVKTVGGLGSFDPKALTNPPANPAAEKAQQENQPAEAAQQPAEATQKNEPGKAEAKPAPNPMHSTAVIIMLVMVVTGFFATAGAAGCDFGMNNRDVRDVQLGGLVGIAGATIFAGGLALLIVAGAYGAGLVPAGLHGKLNPLDLMRGAPPESPGLLDATAANVIMIALALSSFPPACFSAFIAANSFKTTLPNVNPFISVGLGTVVSIILAVTGWAGQVVAVFQVIGASFGPICGAMAADYLLSGRRWAGPRAGFNPAGWISWVFGFLVGAVDFIAKIPGLQGLEGAIPAPPVAAFVVGFVLYALLAKAGLESQKLQMPGVTDR